MGADATDFVCVPMLRTYYVCRCYGRFVPMLRALFWCRCYGLYWGRLLIWGRVCTAQPTARREHPWRPVQSTSTGPFSGNPLYGHQYLILVGGQNEDIGRGGVERRKVSHYKLTESASPISARCIWSAGLVQPDPDLHAMRVIGHRYL